VQLSNAIPDLEFDVVAFHDGRQDVLHAIYKAYGAVLLREARRRTGAAEAEAVVHEVFVELLRNRALRQQFTGGEILSWLRRIAHFKTLEHLRRARRYVADEMPDVGISREADIEAREVLARFLAAGVPPAQREFFGLRFLERRTQVEIATSLGIPRSTLEGWEHRLLKKLRAFIMEGT
jgi:RNA polymerase sigma factor (sigma-70 family)